MSKVDAAHKDGRGRPRSAPEVGQRISALCEQIGSRTKTASAAGISADQLLRIIRGVSEPSLITVTKLAEEAGVSIDWIVYGDAASAPDDAAESDALDTELLSEAIAAVNAQLEQRNIRLPPDKQSILINEIYIHLREEKRHGPQDDTRLINLIRSMVKVAS